MTFPLPILFLGFPVSPDFARLLSKANPHVVSLFIQKGEGEYLQEMIFKEKIYLGKSVANLTDFSELELLEKHIYSILKKLVPDYPFKENPLVLFTHCPPSQE